MGRFRFHWDDASVEMLKVKWAEGLSGGQIARLIGGGVTRNAAIGKVHRLVETGELAYRVDPDAEAKAAKRMENARQAKEKQAKEAQAKLETAVSEIQRSGAPSGICPPARLPEARTAIFGAGCCWPIGDPLIDGFQFCGARRDGKRPYCEEHARKAYQPQQSRKVNLDEDSPLRANRHRLRPGQTSLWR